MSNRKNEHVSPLLIPFLDAVQNDLYIKYVEHTILNNTILNMLNILLYSTYYCILPNMLNILLLFDFSAFDDIL